MRKQNRPLPSDIESRLPLARRALEDDPRVVFAYLFGGLARGRASPLSDVDVAVYLASDADVLSAKLDLIGAITRVLATDAVDLVVLNEAPLSLAGRIQQGAQVLVDKEPGCRFVYESLIRREFADFQMQEQKILNRRFGLDRQAADPA